MAKGCFYRIPEGFYPRDPSGRVTFGIRMYPAIGTLRPSGSKPAALTSKFSTNFLGAGTVYEYENRKQAELVVRNLKVIQHPLRLLISGP
jgi:hypothetical protein